MWSLVYNHKQSKLFNVQPAAVSKAQTLATGAAPFAMIVLTVFLGNLVLIFALGFVATSRLVPTHCFMSSIKSRLGLPLLAIIHPLLTMHFFTLAQLVPSWKSCFVAMPLSGKTATIVPCFATMVKIVQVLAFAAQNR